MHFGSQREGSEQLQADNESGKQKNKNVSDRRIIMNLIVAADKNWGHRKRQQTSGEHPFRYEIFPSGNHGKSSSYGKKDS